MGGTGSSSRITMQTAVGPPTTAAASTRPSASSAGRTTSPTSTGRWHSRHASRGVQTIPLSLGGLREPHTYPDSNRNRGRVGVAQRQPCTDEDAARERDGLPARRSWPQLQQQRQRFRCRRKSRCQRRVDHRAEEPASKTIRFFARIDNLLDRRYASFGILGTNVFTGEGRSFDPDNPRHEQFRGYGAPRSLSVGMQIAFGGA